MKEGRERKRKTKVRDELFHIIVCRCLNLTLEIRGWLKVTVALDERYTAFIFKVYFQLCVFYVQRLAPDDTLKYTSKHLRSGNTLSIALTWVGSGVH